MSSSDLIEYTVEVDTVYAGEVPAVTVVQSARESASCGVDLVPGTSYLLLTDPETTDLVGLCGGTAELRLVTADQLAVLGEGSAPAPAPADGDPGAEPAGRELTGEDTGSTSAVGWGLGGVGIAGLLMFAAIWWPRRG